MTLRVELEDGVVGEAVGIARNLLEVVAERAYAPGCPLQVRVTLDAQAVQMRAKCLGSKRRADGAFTVRLRLVDLRREHRASLQAILGGGSAGESA